MGCLQEYQANEDRQLSPTTLTRLQTMYKRSVRSSQDPFKKAVYCIVGQCNLQDNHNKVVVKTEDYMWLKVMIVGSNVVLINRITIRNGRLLGNFVTIGIGKFQGCNICLLKSNDLITLYLKLNQIL